MSFKVKNKKQIKNIIKSYLIIFFCFVFFVGIYFILKHTQILKIFSNLYELKQIIKSAGFWSYSVFAVLQFLQVTILPLPSSLTTIAGVIIFGPLIAFIISTLSIILGSIFAYACGRFLGEKFLTKFIKENKIKKFQKIFEKGNCVFFIMMLFPLFPDDILCLVAGLTNMKFKFFLTTNLITRPMGLFCLCFFGSGKLIPNSLLGILIFVLAIAIFIVTVTLIFFKVKKKYNF